MATNTSRREAVVVPAIAAASSISALRTLGRRGVPTIAVSERPTAPGFSSTYCEEAIVVPSPATDLTGYRDALLALAGRDDVRTILPVREEDVYVLSKSRPAFDEHVECLWPAFEALRDVHDRVRLMEAASAAGVSVPKTRPLDEVDDWGDELVVKARYAILTDEYVDSLPPGVSRDGGSTEYLSPGEPPDVAAIRRERAHVPIVQEYVPGEEYAFWALYDGGEPVATCQRRRIRGFKYAGNASIFRETVAEPALEEAGLALLNHLDWHGLASVQFVRDADSGEFTLMEINPRLWLSVEAAIRAGADFPYFYWLLAGGEAERIASGYEVGVATHLLRGEVSYLHSVLCEDSSYVERPSLSGALREVASSLVAEPHFDYLCLEDPRPFVRDFANVLVETIGGPSGTDAEGSSGAEDERPPTSDDDDRRTATVEP